MTQGSMADVLTGISALRDGLVGTGGDIAAAADKAREVAHKLREAGRRAVVSPKDVTSLGGEVEEIGAVLEMIAGQFAAGLERLGTLIGDVQGETLAETTRITTADIAAAKD